MQCELAYSLQFLRVVMLGVASMVTVLPTRLDAVCAIDVSLGNGRIICLDELWFSEQGCG